MINRLSKSILVLAAAGLLGAGSVYAGNGAGAGTCDNEGTCDETGGGNGGSARMAQKRQGGPADQMAGMANRLGLTLEQQTKALYLFSDHAQERADLHAAIFDAFGKDICDLRAAHQEDFREILDEEQLAQFDAMQQNRRKRGNRGGGGLGGIDCSEFADD